MGHLPPSTVSGGNILPFAFVKIDSTDNTVVVAGANGEAIGATNGSLRREDATYHAIAGDTVQLQDGDVIYVEAGGSVSAGGRVKSDAAGNAVAVATTGATNQYSPGIALQDGADGGKMAIKWQPVVIRPALS